MLDGMEVKSPTLPYDFAAFSSEATRTRATLSYYSEAILIDSSKSDGNSGDDCATVLSQKAKCRRLRGSLDMNKSTVTGEIAEKMHFFYFLVYRYGVCVPSTCRREDVETIAASLVKSAEFEVKVSNCEVKEDNAKLNADQTAIV
ncbi:hypothetical protein HPB49_006657 [Dermacentor silvarum]|uniref:Uncharacterized protein n=1 Tax=Dermacentor silvarum TaxID=543639 RepID=A0ACB8DWE8_DERSI|nr:hypothetical protein HPB49_006657 [Dermacentor silvarum]